MTQHNTKDINSAILIRMRLIFKVERDGKHRNKRQRQIADRVCLAIGV